jgi:multidrug efflux system membrane fusion protein
VILVWLAGALICWTVAGLHSAWFRRLIHLATPAPVALLERIGEVAARLGLSGQPAAYLIHARIPPLIWVPLAGRPHLLLPAELWGRMTPAQQEAVLAHELAHLKRRDHWVRRLETLACGLYWWDPVAWWARREVERAEERCCDAWVLWALPAAAEAYAEALVSTAVYLSGLRQRLPSGASGAERLNPLKGRLHMILSDSMNGPVARRAPRALLLAGALVLPFLPGLGAAGGAPLDRDDPGAEARASDLTGSAAAIPARSMQDPDNAPQSKDQPREISPYASPLEVKVAHPVVRAISDSEIYAGSVVAGRQVELRARTSGVLLNSTCHPGQVVKAEERLFQIDQRFCRAELDRAQAEFEGAEARRARRTIELKGAKRLKGQHTISQDKVDRITTELSEAEAALKVAAAARDLARLKLESTDVRAPFAGTISGPVLSEGNLVVADSTTLATIITTDPVYVDFPVAQYTVQRMNQRKREARVNGRSWAAFPVTVIVETVEQNSPLVVYLEVEGKLISAEPRIDPNTGTSRWRAEVPNPDANLLPGMGVTVKLGTGEPHNALVIPENALMTDRGQKFVFVVTAENIVEKRPVIVGNLENGLRAINGAKADEWVAINRTQVIKSGDKVVPVRPQVPADTKK